MGFFRVAQERRAGNSLSTTQLTQPSKRPREGSVSVAGTHDQLVVRAVHLWRLPANQGEPCGTHRQDMDNRWCPLFAHSLALRDHRVHSFKRQSDPHDQDTMHLSSGRQKGSPLRAHSLMMEPEVPRARDDHPGDGSKG